MWFPLDKKCLTVTVHIQCRAPYASRSALEIFPKSWKHKGHFGNIKGHLSARMPLMFPNFQKSLKHKRHSENIRG